MNIQLFDNFEELKSHRDQWDRLAGSFPFYRWAWMGHWFECMAAHGKPAVLVGMEAGQWVGIAPFWIDDSAPMNCRLRFWGDGKACTDYAGLIADPADIEAFTFAVVDWLTAESVSGGKLGCIDLIELEGITAKRSSDKLLSQAFDASGFTVHEEELEGCWVTELPSSWDELNAGLSKSMRRKTKKAVRRVNDEACKIESSIDKDLDSLWASFVDLHQKRRAMLGEPGCFADSAFEMFLRRSSQELIEEGRAELIVINFEDEPLAAMLLFNDSITNYMYQSGADSSRMKLEPGYQMAVAAIQNSIENGYEYFDFLRGDEPYKSRWLTKRVDILRSRFVPRKLGARLKHNVWLTGQVIKNYLRTQ